MWSKIRHLLWPPRPHVDSTFHSRMHDARAYGLEQQRASTIARRELKQERARRPLLNASGPIEDTIFPDRRKEDRP